MGYYSENIEYISKVEEAAAKCMRLKGELGLANSSENDRDTKLMLNFFVKQKCYFILQMILKE